MYYLFNVCAWNATILEGVLYSEETSAKSVACIPAPSLEIIYRHVVSQISLKKQTELSTIGKRMDLAHLETR